MEIKTGHNGRPYAYEERELAKGQLFSITASDVRRTTSGPHAFVGIANGLPLDSDTFNITRGPDRTRLLNSAYGQLSKPVQALVSKTELAQWLRDFCDRLWDEWISRIAVEDMAGDATIKPASFVLHPYIVEGGGTILFAPPGSGKSYICQIIAVIIDAGTEVPIGKRIWFAAIRQRVLYVNLERSRSSMQARLARVNLCLGLPPNRPMKFLNARGRSLADVADALVRDVHRHQIRGVVIDSISRSGVGSLKEDESANRFIDVVNSIGVWWLAIGHTTRDDQSHLFGSQMFDAGADLMIKLTSQQQPGKDLGLCLELYKGNDTGKKQPEYIGLSFDGDDLMMVYRANDNDFPALAALRKPSMEQAVLAHLDGFGPSTAKMIADATGLNRSNISVFLTTSPEIERLHRNAAGAFYGLRIRS